MNTADIKYELERAEQAMKEAEVGYQAARLERNRLVKAALDAGVSQAEVGRLIGLTRARIAQLR